MKSAATADARLALACLDLTSLNDHDDEPAVAALVERARRAPVLPAAVCVWPRFTKSVRRHLPEGIRVAAVANFPQGGEDANATAEEVRRIVGDGGDEVDLVLPWRALLAGRVDRAAAVLRAARVAAAGCRLKLILETGELGTPSAIAAAAQLGIAEGADFLKTSTGRTPVGATPAAVQAMLQAMAGGAAPTARVGLKISGGLRTMADVVPYLELVRAVLGPAALQPERFRIGASALLADIEAVLRHGAGGQPGAPAA